MAKRVSVTETNPGWAKAITERVTALASKEVVAGYPQGSEAASNTYDNGASVLDVAVWNQFGAQINHPGGTPYFTRSDGLKQFVRLGSPGASSLPKTRPHQINIPARPFIDKAVNLLENDKRGDGAAVAKQVVNGEIDAETALKQIGLVAEDAIRMAITDGVYEPNADSTKRRKRSDKPLVDTGKLRQAVASVVRDRSE